MSVKESRHKGMSASVRTCLDRAFRTFFPETKYSPLDLANHGHTQCWILRLRKLGSKEGPVLQQACSLVTEALSNQPSTSGDTLMTAIVVPAGKKLDVVRNSPYTRLFTLVGPTRVVFAGQNVFTQSVTLHVSEVSPETLRKLDTALVDLQKRMCVRLYTEPGFEGDHDDMPAGYALKLPKLLRYQSMLIPYGLKLSSANTIEEAARAYGADPGPTTESGELWGPLLVSNIHMELAFTGPLPRPEPYRRPYVRDFLLPAEQASVDWSPFMRASNLERVQSSRIKVSSDVYEKLKPLMAYYLLSRCLGRGTTSYLADTVPYTLDEEDLVARTVLYWLTRFHGDYSIVVPLMANSRYETTVRAAISSYGKRLTGAGAGVPSPAPPAPAPSPSTRPT